VGKLTRAPKSLLRDSRRESWIIVFDHPAFVVEDPAYAHLILRAAAKRLEAKQFEAVRQVMTSLAGTATAVFVLFGATHHLVASALPI